MSAPRRVGVVAGTAGDLDLLEQAIDVLADAHEVDHVVPVGEAADDARALVAERARRFPEEREWTDPRYPDFVLHAVLAGVAVTPTAAEVVARRKRLEALLAPSEPAERVGIRRVPVGDRTLAVLPAGAAPPADVDAWIDPTPGSHGVERAAGRPPRLRPGRLGADRPAGEPAVCAVVAVHPDGGLDVAFVDLGGEVVGRERLP